MPVNLLASVSSCVLEVSITVRVDNVCPMGPLSDLPWKWDNREGLWLDSGRTDALGGVGLGLGLDRTEPLVQW